MEGIISFDMEQGKPQWPFSCYGVTLDFNIARNLIEGDISPEEMRLDAYIHARSSNFEIHVRHYVLGKKIQKRSD